MGRTGIALVLAVLLVTSGCSEIFDNPRVPEGGAPPGVEPGESVRDVLSEWESQRAQNTPVGLAASLSVDGPYTVRADDDALRATELAAPFRLAPAPAFPSDAPYVLFQNATVAGEGEGSLLVRGSAITVTDGRFRNLSVERAASADSVHLRLQTTDSAPEPASTANETIDDLTFFGGRANVSATDLRLTDYQAAVLFVGNESRRLSGPLTVSAPAIWWAEPSTVRTDGATLRTGRFAVVAPSADVVVQLDARSIQEPTAVFAQNATLTVAPDRVRASSLRVRQALTADGPAIDARVEVLPERVTVPVARNETAWVEVHYREATYEGDAILRNVSVTGPGAAYVTVPLERPRLYVVQSIRDLANSSAPVPLKAAGIIALAPVAALEIVVRGFATAVSCIVADCPRQHPFPTWIYAGEIGTFYYKVNATGATPGTYNATIHVQGENYETVTIPVRVNVTTAAETPAERIGDPGSRDLRGFRPGLAGEA